VHQPLPVPAAPAGARSQTGCAAAAGSRGGLKSKRSWFSATSANSAHKLSRCAHIGRRGGWEPLRERIGGGGPSARKQRPECQRSQGDLERLERNREARRGDRQRVHQKAGGDDQSGPAEPPAATPRQEQ